MRLLSVTALAVLGLSHLNAQEKLLGILPVQDGKVVYTEVVQVEGGDQGSLYAKLQRWVVDNYRSGKDVIQVQDAERSEVIGKGFTMVNWTIMLDVTPVQVWHTVALQAKDGRYRYEFNDFTVDYSVRNPDGITMRHVRMPLEEWLVDRDKQRAKIYPQLDDAMQGLVSTLKASVTAPLKDDW